MYFKEIYSLLSYLFVRLASEFLLVLEVLYKLIFTYCYTLKVLNTPRGRRRRGGVVPINKMAESFSGSQEGTPPLAQHVPPIVEGADRLLLLKLTQGVKKLGAVPFLGGTDYFIAKTWIRNMIGYFKMVTCTEIEKVLIAAFFFQEEAR